ncbi:hypothetical protein LTR53_019991, partial [Teratosphaeriaceae sp. CCFEE 6253]
MESPNRDVEAQLDKQMEGIEATQLVNEAGDAEIDEMKTERAKMEASLAAMKESMERQLREQKMAFELEMAEMKKK